MTATEWVALVAINVGAFTISFAVFYALGRWHA